MLMMRETIRLGAQGLIFQNIEGIIVYSMFVSGVL